MSWFLHAVLITTCATLVGAVVGIVLLFLKRWAIAHLVAKRVTLIALVVLGVVVAELRLLWSAAGVAPPLLGVLPLGDPSMQARALAQGISDIVNSAALAIPAAVLGGIGWVVARGQLERRAPVSRR